jgi:hypothetical protein
MVSISTKTLGLTIRMALTQSKELKGLVGLAGFPEIGKMMDRDGVLLAMIARLAPAEVRPGLAAKVREIAEETGEAASLSGEYLTLASIIVEVGVIALETHRIMSGARERDRDRRVLEILTRLAEQSGDPSVQTNPTVRKVTEAAVDVLDESPPAP